MSIKCDWIKWACQLVPNLAKARRLRAESGGDEEHGAGTMCGTFCAYKVMNKRETPSANG